MPNLTANTMNLNTNDAVDTAPLSRRLRGGFGGLCALALSLPSRADAAPLTAGSAMPPLSLNDQHDKPAAVGTQTRWLVFTADKPVSDMVSAVLADELRTLLDLPARPSTP